MLLQMILGTLVEFHEDLLLSTGRHKGDIMHVSTGNKALKFLNTQTSPQ